MIRSIFIKPFPPYFVGHLRFDCPPDDDSVMILTAPLRFIDSRGDEVEAEAGLRTDGASVGALLRIPLIGWLTRLFFGGDQFTGPFRWPAIPHDEEYKRAKDVTFWKAFRSPERKAADRRFFEGARARWVVTVDCRGDVIEVLPRKPAAWWRAAGAHAILRAAGWKAWMDNAREQGAKNPKLPLAT